MTNGIHSRLLAGLCGMAVLVGCGSGSVGSVGGQVLVDGAAAEIGTITFTSAENPTGRGAGGAISEGRFVVSASEGMKPGKYLVVVQAMKSTGKTRNDPQKGEVPVLQSLELVDSPQEVEVTSANAAELTVDFHSRK